MIKRTRFLLALLALIALVAAACGDDDDTEATNTTETTVSDDQPEDDGDDVGGEPIKVMVLATATGPLNYSETFAAVEARAQAVNEAGGINGRPVEIITCDDAFDPNEAQACAREAVEEDVVTVINGFTIYGDNEVPILAEAGIPVIGTTALSNAEATSENSFILSGGWVTSGGAGAVAASEEAGCTNAAVLAGEQQAATLGVQTFTQVFESLGGSVVAEQRLSSGTGANPDMSAVVASFASAGAECAWVFVTPVEAGQFVGALAQSGEDMTVIGNTSTIPAPVRDQLGSALEGAYLAAGFPDPLADSDAEGVAQAIEEYDTVDHEVDLTAIGLGAWTSADVLFDLMSGIDGEVSASSVMEALSAASDISHPVLGDVDLTEETPLEGSERLFNLNALIYQIGADGTLERVTEDFIDITQYLN